jgi:hypothetical protein
VVLKLDADWMMILESRSLTRGKYVIGWYVKEGLKCKSSSTFSAFAF